MRGRQQQGGEGQTATDLDMSIGTAHTIMTKDLGYKPYKKRKIHGVTEATTKKSWTEPY